tara:strand:+ start:5868 stop:9443 length:3576 start_codon:yes stop_codon:yes gene_type:complete
MAHYFNLAERFIKRHLEQTNQTDKIPEGMEDYLPEDLVLPYLSAAAFGMPHPFLTYKDLDGMVEVALNTLKSNDPDDLDDWKVDIAPIETFDSETFVYKYPHETVEIPETTEGKSIRYFKLDDLNLAAYTLTQKVGGFPSRIDLVDTPIPLLREEIDSTLLDLKKVGLIDGKEEEDLKTDFINFSRQKMQLKFGGSRANTQIKVIADKAYSPRSAKSLLSKLKELRSQVREDRGCSPFGSFLRVDVPIGLTGLMNTFSTIHEFFADLFQIRHFIRSDSKSVNIYRRFFETELRDAFSELFPDVGRNIYFRNHTSKMREGIRRQLSPFSNFWRKFFNGEYRSGVPDRLVDHEGINIPVMRDFKEINAPGLGIDFRYQDLQRNVNAFNKLEDREEEDRITLPENYMVINGDYFIFNTHGNNLEALSTHADEIKWVGVVDKWANTVATRSGQLMNKDDVLADLGVSDNELEGLQFNDPVYVGSEREVRDKAGFSDFYHRHFKSESMVEPAAIAQWLNKEWVSLSQIAQHLTGVSLDYTLLSAYCFTKGLELSEKLTFVEIKGAKRVRTSTLTLSDEEKDTIASVVYDTIIDEDRWRFDNSFGSEREKYMTAPEVYDFLNIDHEQLRTIIEQGKLGAAQNISLIDKVFTRHSKNAKFTEYAKEKLPGVHNVNGWTRNSIETIKGNLYSTEKLREELIPDTSPFLDNVYDNVIEAALKNPTHNSFWIDDDLFYCKNMDTLKNNLHNQKNQVRAAFAMHLGSRSYMDLPLGIRKQLRKHENRISDAIELAEKYEEILTTMVSKEEVHRELFGDDVPLATFDDYSKRVDNGHVFTIGGKEMVMGATANTLKQYFDGFTDLPFYDMDGEFLLRREVIDDYLNLNDQKIVLVVGNRTLITKPTETALERAIIKDKFDDWKQLKQTLERELNLHEKNPHHRDLFWDLMEDRGFELKDYRSLSEVTQEFDGQLTCLNENLISPNQTQAQLVPDTSFTYDMQDIQAAGIHYLVLNYNGATIDGFAKKDIDALETNIREGTVTIPKSFTEEQLAAKTGMPKEQLDLYFAVGGRIPLYTDESMIASFSRACVDDIGFLNSPESITRNKFGYHPQDIVRNLEDVGGTPTFDQLLGFLKSVGYLQWEVSLREVMVKAKQRNSDIFGSIVEIDNIKDNVNGNFHFKPEQTQLVVQVAREEYQNRIEGN